PALPGERVIPATSCPSATSKGTSRTPITPVAPATKIRTRHQPRFPHPRTRAWPGPSLAHAGRGATARVWPTPCLSIRSGWDDLPSTSTAADLRKVAISPSLCTVPGTANVLSSANRADEVVNAGHPGSPHAATARQGPVTAAHLGCVRSKESAQGLAPRG